MSFLLTNCPSEPSSFDLGSNGSKLSTGRTGSRRIDVGSKPGSQGVDDPLELRCRGSSLGMKLYVELLVGPMANRKLPGGGGGGGDKSLLPGLNERGPKGPPCCMYGEVPVKFHLKD